MLQPYCRPEWRVTGFRDHWKAVEKFAPDGEGQQRNFRVCSAGIHANVRQLLQTRIDALETRYRKTKDATVKAELDRLRGELEKLPER